MNFRHWEWLLWGLTCTVVAIGMALLPEPLAYSARLPEELVSFTQAATAADESARSSAVRRIVEGDPFRFERRPARLAYGEVPEAAAMVPIVKASRPNFTLVGILGGSPWQAVIDGIPNRSPGVIARHGDSFGDFRISTITRDSVVVVGKDTMWTLVIRGARR
jgi:hypothetical protein